MPTTKTSFDGLLTSYQQQDAIELLHQAERVSNVLHGARQMGMDVPRVDVIKSGYVWAGPNTREPAVDLYVPIKPFGARYFTALRRGAPGGPHHRFMVLTELDFDRCEDVVTEWDNLQSCEILSAEDVAIELSAVDVDMLDKTLVLGSDWAAYLGDYLSAMLDVRGLTMWRPGLRGEDGSLYMIADETHALTIIRPDGTILPVGHGLIAQMEGDGYDFLMEDDTIIGARIAQLREE